MDADGKADHGKTIQELHSVTVFKRLQLASAIAGKFSERGVEPPLDLFEYTQPHFSKRAWESVAMRARTLLREAEGASRDSDVDVLKTQNSEPTKSPIFGQPNEFQIAST